MILKNILPLRENLLSKSTLRETIPCVSDYELLMDNPQPDTCYSKYSDFASCQRTIDISSLVLPQGKNIVLLHGDHVNVT